MSTNFDINEYYGLEPMTIEQEVELPKNIKRTRICKLTIKDDCESVRRLLASIEFRAKMAPELDDQAHADLMESFARAVAAVRNVAEVAMHVGHNG